jgi:hypothetical protein
LGYKQFANALLMLLWLLTLWGTVTKILTILTSLMPQSPKLHTKMASSYELYFPSMFSQPPMRQEKGIGAFQ